LIHCPQLSPGPEGVKAVIELANLKPKPGMRVTFFTERDKDAKPIHEHHKLTLSDLENIKPNKQD
jgi:hypothetical protein